MIIVSCLLLYLVAILAQNEPSCTSKIYCQGSVLYHVQMSRIFNDSKTFVDLKMKHPEDVILTSFKKLLLITGRKPTREHLRRFVSAHFEEGNELEEWLPIDYVPNPKFLSQIVTSELKAFASNLVQIWPRLTKKVTQAVFEAKELFSFLPVSKAFIIPGGRFKEFYYWDTYWIIKGLLLSEMYQTVEGMLDNFIEMIKNFGFIPNGSRLYYLNRSQPPLLTLMVSVYIERTNNLDWLKQNIPSLGIELKWWLKNRTIRVQKDGKWHMLAHYDSNGGAPRPESYFEDFKRAIGLAKDAQIELWKEIISGAETGWDFSSRWLMNATLTSMKTRRIVPVDLNAFLYQAFAKLSQLYEKLNQTAPAKFWRSLANQWKRSIEAVFYDIEDGIWYDYDLVTKTNRKLFFPSNFAPLWAEAFNLTKSLIIGDKAAQYLQKQNITNFEGGIPTSLHWSNEQWDFPNAWPPLQSIVIVGLAKTGSFLATTLAKEFADKWIRANMIGFNLTGQMFEKYNALDLGKPGSGGEYFVQSGFGWTNGVILEFLDLFYTNKNTS